MDLLDQIDDLFMGPLQASSPPVQQPSTALFGANASQQPKVVLPFHHDSDPPVEIRISQRCQIHKWRNLRMTITAGSLIMIRNDPRKQAITQALAEGFQTLENCTFSDSENSTPALRFKCGNTRFIARGAINHDEVIQWTIGSAEEQPEDEAFALTLRPGGKKRDAEESPPKSPDTLHRMALRQSRAAHHGSSSPIAFDSAGRLKTPEPIDEGEHPQFFEDALTVMGFPNAQTQHGLPVEGAWNQATTLGEHELVDDHTTLLAENIDSQEQRTVDESANPSTMPGPMQSDTVGESSSDVEARTVPTDADAFPRYAKTRPLPQVQKIIDDEPAISLIDLFKKIAPGDAKNDKHRGEAEHFHTYVIRNATGETTRATDVLANMATFLSTRKIYEESHSPQPSTLAKFLEVFEEAVFGPRPLVKKVSEGLDDPSESNPFRGIKKGTKDLVLFGARKFDDYLNERMAAQISQEDPLQEFLDARQAYYSRDTTDNQVITFLNYRSAIHKLPGDTELEAAWRAAESNSASSSLKKIISVLPEIMYRQKASQEQLSKVLRYWQWPAQLRSAHLNDDEERLRTAIDTRLQTMGETTQSRIAFVARYMNPVQR